MGFRVQGVEILVSGFRCQASCFVFRVSGFGFKIYGLRCRVQALGLPEKDEEVHQVRPGSRFRVQGWGLGVGGWGLKFRVSGFGFRVSGFGFRV